MSDINQQMGQSFQMVNITVTSSWFLILMTYLEIFVVVFRKVTPRCLSKIFIPAIYSVPGRTRASAQGSRHHHGEEEEESFGYHDGGTVRGNAHKVHQSGTPVQGVETEFGDHIAWSVREGWTMVGSCQDLDGR